ncbi:MAG: hypothetical protein GC192_22495 [Bacteroidetes bacterium]|nr:hypothetical protein [Bacteroidota bacterium]
MKKSMFFFAFLLTANFMFSKSQSEILTECSAPSNLTVVSQTSSSVSFDWDDCGCGETSYKVYYVKAGQASSPVTTPTSDITFSSLSSGTYTFYFATICGEDSSSIIVEEIIIA